MDDAPRQRTEDDFDALYRGHVTDVYRYSLSLVRDPADAEDVTQTTFLNAYEAFSEHPPRKPRPWLIAIARNVCHERYRQALRRPQQVALHEVATTPDENHGVRAEQIISALQGIPSRQRMALLLDGLEGRSRAEIAQRLEIGEATVSGLLTRGRNNLRLQLDQGMTCERAQWASPRLWANGLPRAERRAAIAHLRNCESCSVAFVPPRSLSGLIGLLWLGTRKVTDPFTRYFPTGSGAAGASGALAAKIVLLAAVGTLAGGVALYEAGSFDSASANASAAGAVAGSKDAAKRTIGRATLIPAPATIPPATLISVATAAAAVGQSPAVRAEARHAGASAGDTAVATSGSAPGAQTGDSTGGRLLATTPDSGHDSAGAATDEGSPPASTPDAGDGSTGSAATSSDGSASGQSTSSQSATGQGGSQSAPSGQTSKPVASVTGHATAPGRVKKPVGATTGKTRAPGQVTKTGTTTGKATAPGQIAHAGGSTPGHATAPGQVKDADAAAKAAAPGLVKKTDGATTGQASAPAQQTTPTDAGSSTTAAGQSGSGQANGGQNTTGQSNSTPTDPSQGGGQGPPTDPGGGSGNADAGGQGGGGGHDPKNP